MTDYDRQEIRDRNIIKKYVCENYLHIIIGKTKCERYKKRNAIIRV